MPRKDFISDNLVHMRERLKANYAQNVQEKTENTPPPPAVPVNRIAAPPQTDNIAERIARPSAPRSSANPDEAERIRRDLEGRVRRDCAEVIAELELLELKKRELDTFMSVLNEQLDRLESSAPGSDDIRGIELLRLKYFQASGRAAAFRNPASAGNGSAVPAAKKGFGRLVTESLPLGIMLLLGALLLSLTLLSVFG